MKREGVGSFGRRHGKFRLELRGKLFDVVCAFDGALTRLPLPPPLFLAFGEDRLARDPNKKLIVSQLLDTSEQNYGSMKTR